MTHEELVSALAAAQAENAALLAKATAAAAAKTRRAGDKTIKAGTKTLTLRVSEKGGVSVYGLGRFPVTLYGEQWSSLNIAMGEIIGFIADHGSELKTKE